MTKLKSDIIYTPSSDNKNFSSEDFVDLSPVACVERG
jgi:hypothetical protein